MIELVKGSIFNSKCDLLIIPCDNMGGVTKIVAKEIIANSFPYLHRAVMPGDVVFFQSSGVSPSVSTMIGYAASVDARDITSSEKILHQIMTSIKHQCQLNSLQKVNIPLLGTGAGGLSAKTSYNVMKKAFEKDPDVLLRVHALSEYIYNELAAENVSAPERKIRNPRVFISYTGSDIKNRNWVKKFACKLRECGVNARLDMFHLKPGQDLPQWMTNELIMADKVLLICDKYYAEKADNRKGGVGWETMIIQGDMLSRQEQNKYIAILRDPNIDQSLPIYVKSRYALNWANEDQVEEEFNKLLLYLFDCDIEPPIGKIPSFIEDKLA